MNLQYFLGVVFLSATFSCKEPDTGFTEVDKKNITDSIRQTLNNYFADIKKEGLTAELKYLDNSSDFFWAPPGYRSPISYDSVTAILNKYEPFYKTTDNTWDILMIKPLTNKLASYSGRIHSITTDTSGKISSYTLVETGLVIRRQSGWKLLNGQTSVVEND